MATLQKQSLGQIQGAPNGIVSYRAILQKCQSAFHDVRAKDLRCGGSFPIVMAVWIQQNANLGAWLF